MPAPDQRPLMDEEAGGDPACLARPPARSWGQMAPAASPGPPPPSCASGGVAVTYLNFRELIHEIAAVKVNT